MGNGKGSSSWVRQQYENTHASGPCVPDPSPLKRKINRLRQTVEVSTDLTEKLKEEA